MSGKNSPTAFRKVSGQCLDAKRGQWTISTFYQHTNPVYGFTISAQVHRLFSICIITKFPTSRFFHFQRSTEGAENKPRESSVAGHRQTKFPVATRLSVAANVMCHHTRPVYEQCTLVSVVCVLHRTARDSFRPVTVHSVTVPSDQVSTRSQSAVDLEICTCSEELPLPPSPSNLL